MYITKWMLTNNDKKYPYISRFFEIIDILYVKIMSDVINKQVINWFVYDALSNLYFLIRIISRISIKVYTRQYTLAYLNDICFYSLV